MKAFHLVLLLTCAVLLVLCEFAFAQAPTQSLERVYQTSGEFTRFGAMTVDRAGRLVAAHESTVLIFDTTGKQVATFGRRGSGPGEFNLPSPIGVRGDTLWLHDVLQFRTTYVSSSGTLLRTVPLQAGSLGTRARLVAVARGDTLIVSLKDQAFPRFSGAGQTFYAVMGQGRRIRELGRTTSSPQCYVSDSGAAGSSTLTAPHCLRQFADVSHDGSRLVIVSYESRDPSAYRVTSIKSNGDTVFSRRFTFEPIPLSRRVADSIQAQMIDGAPESLARVLRRMTLPSTYPPITACIVGVDGSIWLAKHAVTSTRTWIVLDATGRPAGLVDTPTRFTLRVASHLQVWGTELDEDDVPSVTSYRVR